MASISPEKSNGPTLQAGTLLRNQQSASSLGPLQSFLKGSQGGPGSLSECQRCPRRDLVVWLWGKTVFSPHVSRAGPPFLCTAFPPQSQILFCHSLMNSDDSLRPCHPTQRSSGPRWVAAVYTLVYTEAFAKWPQTWHWC